MPRVFLGHIIHCGTRKPGSQLLEFIVCLGISTDGGLVIADAVTSAKDVVEGV